MERLSALYEDYRGQVSLRGLMRLVNHPYWQLRDYRRGAARRQGREQAHAQAREAIRAIAAQDTSYGYRRVYQHVRLNGLRVGREQVRRWMGELGLQPKRPAKRARSAPQVTRRSDWPPGRRLQIDATRLRCDDGVAWIYLVEDVTTRQCLAASVAATLSQERAAQTLLEGHHYLQALGLDSPRLIQSDAGSDFTAKHFQAVCHDIGRWVRCRVAQVGGMGILERLNRTFKHEFIFRQEVTTRAALAEQLPAFKTWYNEQRLHSRLGYRTPAAVLAEEVAAIPS